MRPKRTVVVSAQKRRALMQATHAGRLAVLSPIEDEFGDFPVIRILTDVRVIDPRRWNLVFRPSDRRFHWRRHYTSVIDSGVVEVTWWEDVSSCGIPLRVFDDPENLHIEGDGE